MKFREWLQQEATFDPKVARPEVFKNATGKPYLSRSFAVNVDNQGRVVPHDYNGNRSHAEIQPKARSISLHKLSPQSQEFHRIIAALRPHYPDIDQWEVHHYFMAGLMQAAGQRERTVNYWLRQPPVRLKNKLPQFFYHGTCTNLWYEGIKTKGLVPRKFTGSSGSYGAQNVDALSHDDKVYLSTDPDVATRTAAQQAAAKHGGQPLILKINTQGLDPNKLAPDEDTKTNTPQQSVDMASVLAYTGIIPAGNIQPFLIGQEKQTNHRLHTDWEYFKDVPIGEHPLTRKLKNNQIPYSGDPEYYALKDAGIIDQEEIRPPDGWPYKRDVLKDPDITDDKIKSLLKNSGWTQNVKLILKDLNDGYSGHLYKLKNNKLTPEMEASPLFQALLQSGLVTTNKYKDDTFLDVQSWNPEANAIKLAKLLGRQGFSGLVREIDALTKED